MFHVRAYIQVDSKFYKIYEGTFLELEVLRLTVKNYSGQNLTNTALLEFKKNESTKNVSLIKL